MRAQCSISLNKDPSFNKLPNIPTAFSLAVSHSDPYTHNTLPTHPLPFPEQSDKCFHCLLPGNVVVEITVDFFVWFQIIHGLSQVGNGVHH